MDNKNITRIITGTILGVIVLMSLIKGGWALFVITLLFILFATREYVAILKNKGFYPSIKVILFADLFFAVLAYLNRFNMVSFAVTICSITAFIWVLFNGRQPYIANVATTILGFVYCGWFPLHLLFLRDLGSNPIYDGIIKQNVGTEGAGYALLLFFAVILTDSFCYYVGCRFGKHKLSHVISPNKTIEGAIGGTTMCILFCLIFGIYVIGFPWYHALILGFIIAFCAQIGDLCESMIKRDAGVKDSSNVLPGHGGFLDRTDSYIFTIPIVHYYMYFFVVNNFWDLFRGMM